MLPSQAGAWVTDPRVKGRDRVKACAGRSGTGREMRPASGKGWGMRVWGEHRVMGAEDHPALIISKHPKRIHRTPPAAKSRKPRANPAKRVKIAVAIGKGISASGEVRGSGIESGRSKRIHESLWGSGLR